MVRVRNDGVGQWTAETAWTLEESLRLGSQDGGGPELFSQIAFIITDDEGRIYVLDYPAQDIRVFHASGEFSHIIGGKGGGPGEFSEAAGLNWGPDGRLWVWGRRYSAFSASGEFDVSFPRRLRGVIYPWMGGFLPDGRYVDWELDRETLGSKKVGIFLVNNYSGRTTFSPFAFSPPDQLDSLPPLVYWAEVTEDGQRKTPSKSLVVALAREGHLWFAHSDDYTVFRRTLAGDTVLSFSMPSRPMRVPAGEIDSLVSAASRRGRPMDRDRFSAHRPLVTRLRTDDVGHVYVLPQEEGLPKGSAIDVFEESGVYLGRMHFPERVLVFGPPPHITSSDIYAVVLDELDVPYVVRYRIVRPKFCPPSMTACPAEHELPETRSR